MGIITTIYSRLLAYIEAVEGEAAQVRVAELGILVPGADGVVPAVQCQGGRID